MTVIAHNQPQMVKRRRESERGFALLETLIAFLILALGLGALMVGVAVALRSDTRTNANRVAMRLAQSRLEMAGVSEPLVPGHWEGRIGEKYRWEQTVSEVQLVQSKLPESAASPADGAKRGVTPYWVNITVRTPDGSEARIAGLKIGVGSQK